MHLNSILIHILLAWRLIQVRLVSIHIHFFYYFTSFKSDLVKAFILPTFASFVVNACEGWNLAWLIVEDTSAVWMDSLMVYPSFTGTAIPTCPWQLLRSVTIATTIQTSSLLMKSYITWAIISVIRIGLDWYSLIGNILMVHLWLIL